MTSGEQLTLLPAASLASLSVWPGSREARQMTVTSGQKLLASLPSCDRKLSWLRTLVASSAWRSTMCLLTWKHKVTPQGRSYYQLQVSVPRTSEIGSGLLRSPSAQEAGGIPPELLVDKDGNPPTHFNQRLYHKETGRVVQMGLQARMRVEMMLPTPTADDANNVTRESGQFQSLTRAVMFPTPSASNAGNDINLTCSGGGRMKPNKLGWAVAAMLPTPRARDANAEGFESGMRRDSPTLPTVVKMGLLPTPRAARAGRECKVYPNSANHGDLEQEVAKELPTAGMKLNPAWVSRMMGFPDGWMDVGEETP